MSRARLALCVSGLLALGCVSSPHPRTAPTAIGQGSVPLELPASAALVAVSRDGELVGVWLPDLASVAFFDLADRSHVATVEVSGEVTELEISGRNRVAYLAVRGRHRKGTGWVGRLDLANGKLRKVPISRSFFSVGLVLDPTEERLYVADTNGPHVLVLGAADLEIRSSLRPPGGAVFGIDLSEDGRLLVAAHAFTGTVSLIETESGATRKHAEPGGTPVAATISGRDIFLADADRGGVVALRVDDERAKSVYYFGGWRGFIESRVGQGFTPTGRISVLEGGLVGVWTGRLERIVFFDAESGRRVHVLGIGTSIADVAFGPRGEILVAEEGAPRLHVIRAPAVGAAR